MLEWDLLGKAIGDQLTTGSIPVVSGDLSGITFDNLRQMLTALAISSNCEMCHIVGCTPEARTVEDAFQGARPREASLIDGPAIRKAYDAVCTSGESPIDFVSLGCPHYSLYQIQQLAAMLDGRKIHPDVQFTVWTVYPVKAMADENGYTRMVEDAGGSINCGTCPASIGDHLLGRHETMLFDSLKQAEAVTSATNKTVYYADTRACVDAAVKGTFSDRYRYA
jgi:predicted aconitase